MSVMVFNTLSKKKEALIPLEPGKIKMYVCGITAYDRCHIGHARSAVVFDCVVRHLRHRGFEVKFIRNFTDIDDKIINRAREEEIAPEELAEREIANFYKDMDALGVLRADIEPRATQHIPEIIALIEKLIEKGHAYEAGGDVYFSVRSFHSYGRLSGRDLDALKAGARIEIGDKKKDPLDFALWKSAKPEEPAWDSPWGPGRPGWHIECSAMSMKYLGETLDIHGGGLDLIFPHHENEQAQSEAATGKTFVRYWMHNGFVTIKGEKMSKSLGNFITIHEILKEYHPEALRLFLLSKHYRSPLDYSPETLREWETALHRAYSSLYEAQEALNKPVKKKRPLTEQAQEAIEGLDKMADLFGKAMDDDFNSAKAIGHLFDGIRLLNRLIKESQERPSALLKEPIEKGAKTIREAAGVLGVLSQEPADFLDKANRKILAAMSLTEEDIERAIEKRALARKEKRWDEADAIRDELAQKGILLQDGPEGTKWTVRLGTGA